MDRRAALKNMSLTLGYAVATPTILSVLQSCTSDAATWTPVFFTKTEGYIITQLADIILPKTDTAGALDVFVPEFMDKMFDEILGDNEKVAMKEGASTFATEFNSVFGKDASEGTKGEYETILATYFDISDDKQKEVFRVLREDKSKLSGTKLNTYLIYSFLTQTRRFTLYGYYTSEHVGENILNYDPIPGRYDACIPLEEAGNGNAWSL
ncbi:gluconate 2-dehydrogenase subunit 3 family protein [Urechidicola vernalis]|uniref:Gluconate 2-dehydrogenase subunit 3 family protein n=1 Tax=Urechidicola vernalis TaxID=3075600 RepID=A0ABU2Y5U1_9FLAO|nr:gluconate 2-dehydrogenase subunit 3 family protein [Urechidicola sp. P050]MDT0553578.1 gluconate 2-dehydrogenase subunit 3 family protein [Urechidicola sp. P050]